MTSIRVHSLPLIIFLMMLVCFAQNKPPAKNSSPAGTEMTVEISDPASVKIEDLFKQADMVGIVKILSGDSEHYSQAIYKAEVVTPYKGVAKGDIIFLGPFVGYRVGWEYLACLKHFNQKMVPSKEASSSAISYGELPFFYRVMYEGYSFMEIGYECIFDGKEINQQCDDGIKLNTFQVVLPKKIKTFPAPPEAGSSSDTKWVRKSRLSSYMEMLRDNALVR
jgi:hypothetical protein